MAPTCIHELDRVRLLRSVRGWRDADGVEVDLAQGTAGTVVMSELGAPWVDVEVVSQSGATEYMFSALVSDLEVVTRHVPGK